MLPSFFRFKCYLLLPFLIILIFFQVTILITDVNDNRPVFSSSFYFAGVSEDVTPLSTVVTVSATDKDLSSNSRIKYGIIDGDADGEKYALLL